MKKIISISVLLILLSCNGETKRLISTKNKGTFKIILKIYLPEPFENLNSETVDSTELPGEIDTTSINKMNEPLLALTAFYSALGGSYCCDTTCNLTSALGLGRQGSDKQKSLIAKYFPNDKLSKLVLEQDCYLRPSGASSFSEYEFLTILDLTDTVYVDYRLMYYDRGDVSWEQGPDIYLYKNGTFKKIKRNIWTWVEK